MIKFLLYCLIATGFLGSGAFPVSVGGVIHVFPYRLVFIVTMLAILVALCLNDRGLGLAGLRVRRQVKFLVFWWLVGALSIAWTPEPAEGVKCVILMGSHLMMVLLILVYLREPGDLRTFYALWLCSFPVLLGLGFYNILTGHQFIEFSAADDLFFESAYFRHKPRATFHNQNDYATYLTMSAPFVLSFMTHAKSRIAQLAAASVLALGVLVLSLTFSRANFVGVAVGFGFWFVFLVRGLTSRLRILATVFGVVALLAVALPSTYEPLSELVGEQVSSISMEESSIKIRTNLAKNAFAFFLGSYGFGTGAGSSEHYMAHEGLYDTSGVTNVHNWWLEILVEYGVWVFAGYVMLYGGLLVGVLRIRAASSNAREREIGDALSTSMVTFLVACAASSSVRDFLPQWLLLAFALAYTNQAWRTKLSADRTPGCTLSSSGSPGLMAGP